MPNIVRDLIVGANSSDGVSAQTTKELMRLGIHPKQDKQKDRQEKEIESKYKDTGDTQQEAYAKRFGVEAARTKAEEQLIQRNMLMRKLILEQQRLTPANSEQPIQDKRSAAPNNAIQQAIAFALQQAFNQS